MKVILSPNPFRDRGLKTAIAAQKILDEVGIKSVFCLPFLLEEDNSPDIPEGLELHEMKDELPGADVLICIGGDGTILHLASDASAAGVPVLGINMGSVGFMAELESGELDGLRKLASGDYRMEDRMMLDVKVRRGNKIQYHGTAINDAVIANGTLARVLDLGVYGDGNLILDFSGDGVILATPTGSTAYSMSAGGPIVEPTAMNTLITPICAHSLQAKPMVVSAERRISVQIQPNSRKVAYLSVDGGKTFKLFQCDCVDVCKAERPLKLIRMTDRGFYEIINQKLGGR